MPDLRGDRGGPNRPQLGCVVLAYGDEPLLVECISSLLSGGADQVVVVDNGPDPHFVPLDTRVSRIDPGRNTGFAGGCNLGAAQLAETCEVLVFANSDLVAVGDAPRVLADALVGDDRLGLVCGLVVEARDPGVINTAGNPVHYSMMSWAGAWGEAVESISGTRPVASATGALMAMRTDDWELLGGLSEAHFAYAEDVELSLRVWQAGRRVACVPDALGLHDYHFSSGQMKTYLLERNRLINLLTLLESSTLAALAPGLAVVEAGVLYAAVRGGWLRGKVRGYRWLWSNREYLWQRRREVQNRRVVSDRELAGVFADRITPSPLTGLAVPPVVNQVLSGWRAIAWPVPLDALRLDAMGDVKSAVPPPSEGRIASITTRGADYTDRLARLEGARWKQMLNVQAPYRARLRRLKMGRTLDIGCGIGRNLGVESDMVGVDHNADSVAVARQRGYRAWTTHEWPDSPDAVPGSFDTLLIAHVLEHMDGASGEALLREYLPYLRHGGRVVMICPQEKGYASDATHVQYYEVADLERLVRRVGLRVESTSSFPLPRAMGRVFTHNEHCVVARA